MFQFESKTATSLLWKSDANSLPSAIASPLKIAPGSPIAPTSACVPSTAGFQPRRTPSSPSKMNLAEPDCVPLVTTKPEPKVLKTVPVGPLSVPMATTRDCGVPAPL